MFNQITEKFQNILQNVRGFGIITDDNIKSTVRDVRKALIDADVNFKVVNLLFLKLKSRHKELRFLNLSSPENNSLK